MPRLVRSLAIVAALAGGGYFALVAYAQEQLRGEIEQLLRQLPPGFSGGYDSLDVSPLARRATATGFTLKNAGRGFEFTARSVEIEDVSPGLAAGWARAIASPAAFDATTALAVAGTIVLRDVAYRSSDSSAKWSLATIADLEIGRAHV